jgi:hypothetical protein
MAIIAVAVWIVCAMGIVYWAMRQDVMDGFAHFVGFFAVFIAMLPAAAVMIALHYTLLLFGVTPQ